LGVGRFVCGGSSEADWGNVLDLAVRETGVIPMLGLHPWYVGEAARDWDARLRVLLQGSPAGVGECGLDFALSNADRGAQTMALEAQWQMAIALGRPLSLHCRKAFDAILALAEKFGLPSKGAVIHAFSGSREQADAAIRRGFYISFACSLLNPNSKRARSAIAAVPPERLMLETDSPDIPPDPGVLNEPANLPRLLCAAAELRGETPEALMKQLQNNADRVFPSSTTSPSL
jgi:TatD DNase family protein